MAAYSTVVVGTDGSESSMKAVERAGAIAGENATLVIACAYFPNEGRDIEAVSDVLRTRLPGPRLRPHRGDPAHRQGGAHRMRAPS